MDEVKQAAAQHGENGSTVVCVGLSAAPDSRRPIDGGLTSFSQSVQSVILVSILIRTYRRGCTSHGLCPAVSRFCDRPLASVSRSVVRSCSHLSCCCCHQYGSVTLTGLPTSLLDILQSVLNAATQLVYRSRKYNHMTPLLHDLHWLRVPKRIAFRPAVLVSIDLLCHTLLMNFTVWRLKTELFTQSYDLNK